MLDLNSTAIGKKNMKACGVDYQSLADGTTLLDEIVAGQITAARSGNHKAAELIMSIANSAQKKE